MISSRSEASPASRDDLHPSRLDVHGVAFDQPAHAANLAKLAPTDSTPRGSASPIGS
jgi:hypothetical protein